jgi:hypothetical protein
MVDFRRRSARERPRRPAGYMYNVPLAASAERLMHLTGGCRATPGRAAGLLRVENDWRAGGPLHRRVLSGGLRGGGRRCGLHGQFPKFAAARGDLGNRARYACTIPQIPRSRTDLGDRAGRTTNEGRRLDRTVGQDVAGRQPEHPVDTVSRRSARAWSIASLARDAGIDGRFHGQAPWRPAILGAGSPAAMISCVCFALSTLDGPRSAQDWRDTLHGS